MHAGQSPINRAPRFTLQEYLDIEQALSSNNCCRCIQHACAFFCSLSIMALNGFDIFYRQEVNFINGGSASLAGLIFGWVIIDIMARCSSRKSIRRFLDKLHHHVRDPRSIQRPNYGAFEPYPFA